MIEFLKNHSCVAVLNWNSSSMIFFLWSWERASYFKNTYAHTSWSHMEILFMQIEVWFSPNFPQRRSLPSVGLTEEPCLAKSHPLAWLLNRYLPPCDHNIVKELQNENKDHNQFCWPTYIFYQKKKNLWLNLCMNLYNIRQAMTVISKKFYKFYVFG